MRSARSSASVWETTSAATCSAPYVSMSSQTACGHGLGGPRPGWRARAPSPARCAAAGIRAASPRRSRSRASRSAGSTWRRLTVSRADGIRPAVASCSMWSAASRRRRPAGTGGDRPAPIRSRPDRRRPRPAPPRPPGGGLGDLVQHHHRPGASGPLVRSMRSRAIVRASRPAPASSATALAVVATAITGRPSAAGGLGGGVQHGRLSVAGRGEHSTAGSHPHRPAPRPPPPDPRPRPGLGPARLRNRRCADRRDGPGGQGVGQGQRAVLHRPVGGGRPLRRPAPARLGIGGQPHRRARTPRTGRPWR